MQDRANVSADFLELMKQEIIEVIKKYIDVDETAMDVRMTNKQNDDGTNGAPALYANIPILSIKDDIIRDTSKNKEAEEQKEESDSVKEEEQNQVLEAPHVQWVQEENKEQEENTNQTEEKNEPQEEEIKAEPVNN